MGWYLATVPHDRMRRGQVYWLEDTEYVANKVANGYLEPADEPDWNKKLPDEKKWPQ